MRSTRPRATRTDVAREAGVSVAVVSYVVNNGPRPVAPATRERVLKAISDIGYRPNGTARALKLGKTSSYGLVVPDISNTFFATMARSLQLELAATNAGLLIANSSDSSIAEDRILRVFLEREVDGIFFISASAQVGVINRARQDGIRAVILDRVPKNVDVSSVSSDNIAGAFEATAHLIGHGRQRIALIGGPADLPTASERALGWSRALTDAHLQVRPQWELSASFTRAGGRHAADQLFGGADDIPDAVFVASEQQALGVLTSAYEHGISVPDDMALATFDGTDDAVYSIPPLTTVAQPFTLLAKTAVDVMLNGTSEAVHRSCGHELIVRESCGCPS